MAAEREAAAPETLPADYFDGRISKRYAAVLACDGGFLIVRGDFGEHRYAWHRVVVGETVGTAPRRIILPDGAHCEVADGRACQRWLASAGYRCDLVESLQQRWRWAAVAVAGVAGLFAAAYIWLLPILAEIIAPRVPPALIASLSKTVLRTLDDDLLAQSGLAEERRTGIRARVATIVAGGLPYQLEFRSVGKTGRRIIGEANAFALPDGVVVVLDGLVGLAANDDEVVAVVAHELGHVHHRHGLRSLIQGSIVSAAVGFYLGDASGIVTNLTSLVLESRYSREFESEADRYAADLLQTHDMNPELLAKMLTRLMDRDKSASGGGPLSSHPDTNERIEALHRRSLPAKR